MNPPRTPRKRLAVNTNTLVFKSRGAPCEATLYTPADTNPPVIVMAHGLGAERSFGLAAYAGRFAAAGFAVLVFDYRNFGGSAGKPRNLINPWRHVEDYGAAIACARSLPGVDASRIALWGTSFSGGHVIEAAVRDGNIAAIVAQIPFVDGRATMRMFSAGFIARSLLHGLRDLGAAAALRAPHTVPIVGGPGCFALMNTPESLPGYTSLLPADSRWRNEAPARIMLQVPFYRPVRRARRLACPALVICARRDSLIPASAVEKAAARMPRGEFAALDCGHFDVYRGRLFAKTIRMEIDFFLRHLCAGTRGAEGVR